MDCLITYFFTNGIYTAILMDECEDTSRHEGSECVAAIKGFKVCLDDENCDYNKCDDELGDYTDECLD